MFILKSFKSRNFKPSSLNSSLLAFPPFFFFAVRINLPICISPLSPPLLKVLLPPPILLILNQNILAHAKEHFALVGDEDFKRIGEDGYYANDDSFQFIASIRPGVPNFLDKLLFVLQWQLTPSL